jgi:hypothetical protein
MQETFLFKRKMSIIPVGLLHKGPSKPTISCLIPIQFRARLAPKSEKQFFLFFYVEDTVGIVSGGRIGLYANHTCNRTEDLYAKSHV